ncbi:hypothetical protein Tco_0789626 [Tanacetum coccineum]
MRLLLSSSSCLCLGLYLVIFKSLSFRLDRLCHLAILCLDQHAHTLHHVESLPTISLDRLDIFEGRSCISEFVRNLSMSPPALSLPKALLKRIGRLSYSPEPVISSSLSKGFYSQDLDGYRYLRHELDEHHGFLERPFRDNYISHAEDRGLHQTKYLLGIQGYAQVKYNEEHLKRKRLIVARENRYACNICNDEKSAIRYRQEDRSKLKREKEEKVRKREDKDYTHSYRVHTIQNSDEQFHQGEDPRSRSFDDYKWMFDLEIDQLADEYELGIGKKGHMLDDIWENFKKVQGDNTYWWYDQKLEEEERREIGVDIEGYDPPRVM